MPTPRAFRDELGTLEEKLATGGATERTHCPALETLVKSLARDITAVNEPRHIACAGAAPGSFQWFQPSQ